MLHTVLSQLLGDDYITIPSVPILDEHVLTTRQGETEAVVDAAYLEVVAANNNSRVERTGDATPLVIGHTRDGAAETEQPPVVGYATNFRVGDFAGSGRQALYSDFHVRRDRESVLRDYPRRSVELWVKKQEVDPISLLGATTPERDLGILRYQRSDDQTLSIPFSRCDSMADAKTKTKYEADKPADVADAEKGESASIREISTKLDKLMSLLGPIAEALGEAMGDGEAKPDEAAAEKPKGDEAEAESDEMKPADDKGESADDEADADDDLLGPADEESEKDAAKFHDQSPVRFGETYLPRVTKMNRSSDDVVKLQRANAAMGKELAEVKLQYSRLAAEKQVAALEAEAGIVFNDRDEDIETLARLSSEAAKKHFVEKIKRNYAKDVTKQSDLARYSRDQVGEPVATMADVQAAVSKRQFKSAIDAHEHFAKKGGK